MSDSDREAGGATHDTGDDKASGAEEASESVTITAPDPGDPGGMGGVHVQGGSRTGRPPGGVSPLDDAERERTAEVTEDGRRPTGADATDG